MRSCKCSKRIPYSLPEPTVHHASYIIRQRVFSPAQPLLQQLPSAVRRATPGVLQAAAAAANSNSTNWPLSNSISRRAKPNAGHTLQATWQSGYGSASSSNSHSHNISQKQQQQQQQAVPPSSLLAASLGSLATALLYVLEIGADALAVQRRRLARVAAKLARPELRLLLEGCQLGACLLFILLYVWSTYSPVVQGGPRWWLDLVLCLVFAADYAHRILVASTHPILAMLHPLALIDLLSFAPSLLGAVLPLYATPWGIDLRWFRVFRALRLLRLSLLSGNLSTMKSNRGALVSGPLNVPLVWLMASVIAWMFTSASCVAVMEKMLWHDALYFVASTLTTVGYGDVVVKSSMGRLFVLVMMLVGVVLIPVRASQLYSRISERLAIAGHPPGDAPGCKGTYVVLSGRLSDVRGFNDFLQDFIVQVRALPAAVGQRGRSALQLVCLSNKPSGEFLALQELHESHLTLVEGSAFSERDLLQRAGLAGSVGVMVLADRFSSNAAAEDTDVQFRVWAMKSAVKRVPLYVQVLRRASVDVISPFLDPFQDVISSIEGTRLRLLALSCFVPGASTLIANLLRSSGPNAGFAGGPRHSSSLHRHNRGSSSSAISSPTSSRDDVASSAFAASKSSQRSPRTWGTGAISLQSLSLSSRDGAAGGTATGAATMANRRWLREYADGAHCELFFCPAGPPLAGLRFSNAAEAVYEATGAMLVGLMQGKSQRLLLNPGSSVIRQGQQLVVLATTQHLAEAGAAGEGLELTQLSQALKAAEVTAAVSHNLYTGHVQQQQQEQAVELQTQQQQQELPIRKTRGVTVRVPSLLTTELKQYSPSQQQQENSIGQGSTDTPKFGQQQQQWQRLWQQQQQQRASQSLAQHEQQLSAELHQQQHLHQHTLSSSNNRGSAAAAAAAAAAASSLVDVISQPGSSSFPTGSSIVTNSLDGLMTDDELALLNPCVANWTGAFESDSMDENEICTDSELLEATLLQRQRQQFREQHQQQQHQLVLGQFAQLQDVQGNTLPQRGALEADGTKAMDAQQHQGQETANSSSINGNGSHSRPSVKHGIGSPVVAAAFSEPQQPFQSPPSPASSNSRQQQHWQQQRQFFGPEPHQPPKHIRGHVIMSGCVEEFLPFADQLHSQAPTAAQPVTIVILHPELPPRDVWEAISRLGPTYYVKGKSSDAAALAAAGAQNARSLAYLGPTERPTHVSSHAVSGVYGDPTSRDSSSAPSDYTSSSRTAVLADADALSSCYGVGEVMLPDALHTVVELGFTSSIRFLQPGLLLHGRSAPHSQGSYDDNDHNTKISPGLLNAITHMFGGGSNSSSNNSDRSSRKGRYSDSISSRSSNGSSRASSPTASSRSASPHSSARSTPPLQQYQQQQQHWQQFPRSHSQQPRSSWRHRKEIEDAGRAEGLTEWQLNSYYAAGRVMVPALLDTFTCQGFFKRRALLELMTELAGDDGRPGGAMLQQLPVPQHLVGCTYRELVTHFLTSPHPQERYVPIGLLRRKAENRAWRLPYVATHPDPEAVLQLTDAVFVIRPQ